MHHTGFPPVVSGKPVILILGSMPGAESLRQQQYYAHSRNLFWEFMGSMFDFDPALPYSQRLKQLTKNQIALWDVIERCERPGSLDSSIKHQSIIVNDFATLLSRYTSIEYIFFNGCKAETEFRRRVAPTLADLTHDIQFELLPSTSPANAGITKTEKFRQWSKIKKIIKR